VSIPEIELRNWRIRLTSSNVSTLSRLTFGTAIRGCPVGRPDAFSAIGRCSGSGRRAESGGLGRELIAPMSDWWPLVSTHVANPPGHSAWHSMQRSMMWLRQIAQLSTTMSKQQNKLGIKLIWRLSDRHQPQAHRATAFHWNKQLVSEWIIDDLIKRTHLLHFESLLLWAVGSSWA